MNLVAGSGYYRKAVGIFFALYVLLCLIGSYQTSFAERDSYRVFAGVMDAFHEGKPISGYFVYGYGVSKGYFVALEQLRFFALDPDTLSRLLNYVTILSVLGLALLVYGVCAHVAGQRAGVFATFTLTIVPVWFYVGQSAHPMWPGMLLYLLAILLAQRMCASARLFLKFAWGLGGAFALATALSVRLDVVLMAPMLLGLCFSHDRVDYVKFWQVFCLGICSLVLFASFSFILLPTAQSGGEDGSALALLLEWHNLDRFLRYAGVAQLRFARAFNPALIVLIVIATLYFLRTGRWAILAFTLPTILLNYLFWIPNAQPERHFLYMVPSVAAIIGGYLAKATEATHWPRPGVDGMLVLAGVASLIAMLCALASPGTFLLYSGGLVLLLIGIAPWIRRKALLAAACVVFFLLNLGMAALPPKYLLANPYSREDPHRIAQLADKIAGLPALDRPLIVISDGYPIVSRLISEKMDGFQLRSINGNWLVGRSRHNDVEFLVQGWSMPLAWGPLAERAKKGHAYFVIDRGVAPEVGERIRSLSEFKEIQLP